METRPTQTNFFHKKPYSLTKDSFLQVHSIISRHTNLCPAWSINTPTVLISQVLGLWKIDATASAYCMPIFQSGEEILSG
jgi:hypothetical protein